MTRARSSRAYIASSRARRARRIRRMGRHRRRRPAGRCTSASRSATACCAPRRRSSRPTASTRTTCCAGTARSHSCASRTRAPARSGSRATCRWPPSPPAELDDFLGLLVLSATQARQAAPDVWRVSRSRGSRWIALADARSRHSVACQLGVVRRSARRATRAGGRRTHVSSASRTPRAWRAGPRHRRPRRRARVLGVHDRATRIAARGTAHVRIAQRRRHRRRTRVGRLAAGRAVRRSVAARRARARGARGQPEPPSRPPRRLARPCSARIRRRQSRHASRTPSAPAGAATTPARVVPARRADRAQRDAASRALSR